MQCLYHDIESYNRGIFFNLYLYIVNNTFSKLFKKVVFKKLYLFYNFQNQFECLNVTFVSF